MERIAPHPLFATTGFLLACLSGAFAQQDPRLGDVGLFHSVDRSGSASAVEEANARHQELLLRNDPQWALERADYEEQLDALIRNGTGSPRAGGVITIPVVVHIVYHTAAENIPDEQVYSQLIVLNDDYLRQNADTVNTPAPFALVAANTGIQFCLAQQDPNGVPTLGIERRETTIPAFGDFDVVQTYSGGGMDQWDPTRYLNIWVCNSLGYGLGEFPVSSTTTTYGAVVRFSRFGSNHTAYGVFPALDLNDDFGRIAVHEVGHCLDLYHPDGDDGGTCTGTDHCADTPDEAVYTNFHCPTFPNFDVCTPAGNGVMFDNYMDNALGSCQDLFTRDQAARMNAVLNMAPYNALAVSNACGAPTGVAPLSSPITGVFPDPFASSTTFHFSRAVNSGHLYLFDPLGNMVRRLVINGKEATLQREDLRAGIYYYQVVVNGTAIARGRIIAE